MRKHFPALVGLATTAALVGFTAAASAEDRPSPDGKALVSGIDRSNFDASIRPQDDLFRHASGAWLKSAEIPAERSLYGAFVELADKAEADLRKIIEDAAESSAPEGSETRKVGDLYASFMDEGEIEKKGLDPIRDELKDVAEIQDKQDFIRELATLQKRGSASLFGFYVDTDEKNSKEYIIHLTQGGLGLPDESYYRDDKFKDVRDAYVKHIARVFELAGADGPEAKADSVMKLETRLAKNHWDRVKSRDASLTYNKKSCEELTELAPQFDWPLYFDTLDVRGKGTENVVVAQPSFFSAMGEALDDVPLETWKTWLAWNVLRENAPLLSSEFVNENFDFYGKTLTGAEELRPRWKRAVSAEQSALGFALGKIYVEKHFPPEAKKRMKALVANLIEAYRRDIRQLDWMSDETKAKALEKLGKFTPKIGYPDKWRDYSALKIERDDLVGNVQRASAFEFNRDVKKLGQPVDRNEWFMTPQTVNAYYNPGMNEIVFPAAILQPPFFNLQADDAVNYGGIGAVIGHEIGHGFDDQGSKYDGDGNMNDWWTDQDREEFEARTKKLISQYDAFEPAMLPGQHVNGALTIGENIGDLGGLTIAYKAYEIALDGQEPPKIDGLTGPQRFFLGWAQVWRIKHREAELMRRLATDPHSPGEFRCNGVVRNLDEFYEAFDVKPGDKLYLPPEERVRIW
jgi:putative endopeptidase